MGSQRRRTLRCRRHRTDSNMATDCRRIRRHTVLALGFPIYRRMERLRWNESVSWRARMEGQTNPLPHVQSLRRTTVYCTSVLCTESSLRPAEAGHSAIASLITASAVHTTYSVQHGPGLMRSSMQTCGSSRDGAPFPWSRNRCQDGV